jgi:AcrR family transcriptional regulator
VPTPRELAREQTLRDIVRIGREQLATASPADLSLRAVARELGLVSSAVYRYVKDRDALLTLLIVDAYDELGAEVEEAVAAASRRSPVRRVQAAAQAMRAWGHREPSRFALLYGTPVPGYAAPPASTNEPGTRVVVALARILEEAHQAGRLREVPGPLPRTLRADMEAIRVEYGLTLPAGNLARGLGLWSAVVGAVVFDVFGQYGPDTLTDPAAFLDVHVAALAEAAGL